MTPKYFAILLLPLMFFAASSSLFAQSSSNSATSDPALQVDFTNPIDIVDSAGSVLDVLKNRDETGDKSTGLSATLSIVILLTVLSLAPAILVMCTSFTRIVVVLALLRQAIGTQSLPPSQVIVGLSLFMTLLVMYPTFKQVNTVAIAPLNAGMIDQKEAWVRAKEPVREFMFDQIEYAGNWDDLFMVMNYRGIDTSSPEDLHEDDVDMLTLIPAFVLSELKVAFLIGFRLYLPFLVIDMVVSSILISMGMMMLPPVMISLPFKLLMFVLVDGWMLVAGNLLNSFSIPGVT